MSSNSTSNTSKFDFPPREHREFIERNRNGNYTEQQSIVINEYHLISSSYTEISDPNYTKNKSEEGNSERSKNDFTDAKVDAYGYLHFGKSETKIKANREGNTSSEGGNHGPLIRELRSQTYEKPVDKSREQPE